MCRVLFGPTCVSVTYTSSLDLSIRITYHPLSSKVGHRLSFTGFTGLSSLSTFGTTKIIFTLYSQRITILNTKRVRIDAMKLFDQIPVSEIEGIKVQILKPAELNKPGKSSGLSNSQSEARSNNLVATPPSKTVSRKSLNSTTHDTGATASISTPSPAPVKGPLDTGRARIIAQWDGVEADIQFPLFPGSQNEAGAKAAARKAMEKEAKSSGAKSEGND
ncbi:hypothetical protein GYMLUDRAFT_60043 [Collybiopsis luxurians FD-317 M1]|uniref:Uncharacterized protein n=1 Tax=Collybiopsis luxurians FD-317 M1 TaxID=944289 RepID=A0A0D0BV99_9AGAR|nr:hypothetical protein GYMLUDRAFT_60043 [Collybiopsis luxurians FD-317 M1]